MMVRIPLGTSRSLFPIWRSPVILTAVLYSLPFRCLCFAALLAAVALRPAVERSHAAPPDKRASSPRQIDLAAAAEAERAGDYTAAEAGYRALAASPDPATSIAGQLALGRFLERRGRPSDAMAPLAAAIGALGDTPDGLRARFLLGEAQWDLHQNEAAAASFQAYATSGGPAGGYAAIERAGALHDAGDDDAALAALSDALQSTSVPVRRGALQAASQSHEQLGNLQQAAADQQALAAASPGVTARTGALLEAGRLYQRGGDNADAVTVLQRVVDEYPSAAAAGSALDRLDVLNAGVDPLQRAIVLFDHGRYAEAQKALQRVLDSNPPPGIAAQATYQLARISDNRDENDAAIAGYADAYAQDPTGPIASDALWKRAQLLKSLDRYGEAQVAYSILVQRLPQSIHAAEAAFDAGLTAYLDGRSDDAETAWTALAQSAESDDAAHAYLWLGKVARARGEPLTAAVDFARAQGLQPTGYYGLRAGVLSAGRDVRIAGPGVTPPPSDWNSLEAWLTSRFGPENPAQFTALKATQDWTEGIELDALGWTVTPEILLDSAITGVDQQPWALYRAARSFVDRGRASLALDAADDLLKLAGVKTGGQLDVPAALLRISYPLDYVEQVNADGAQTGLDPLFIYAVTRQESGFYPAAESSAGAQGLMQLEPSTAQGEADALGLQGYSTADLNRPLINLELGSDFLARQAAAQDREFSQTLAAYNAGGRSASRWEQLAGNDADRFYEAIDFSETRLYVRLVSVNYAVYNYLYRSAPHPTLLHP